MITKELRKLARGDQLISQINTLLPQMKENMLNELKMGLTDEIGKQIGAIKVRDGRDGKDGKSGEDADEIKIIQEIIKEISPKLEKEELEVDKIKGLREILNNFSSRITSIGSRRTKGGGGGSTLRIENLSSQVDGSTRVFTLTRRAGANHALFYSGFPSVLLPTTDYSISGTTLTIVSSVDAPVSGQSLLVIYEDG